MRRHHLRRTTPTHLRLTHVIVVVLLFSWIVATHRPLKLPTSQDVLQSTYIKSKCLGYGEPISIRKLTSFGYSLECSSGTTLTLSSSTYSEAHLYASYK